MRKVVKLVFGLVFSLGIFATAKAQDSSANMPSEDDAIVCVQVSEDMFDCYVMEDSAGNGTNPGYNHSTDPITPEDQGREDDQWNNNQGDSTNWDRSHKNNRNPSKPEKGTEVEGGSEVKEERGKGIEIYKEEKEDETNPPIQAME